MGEIKCFMLEEAGRARVWLRRWQSESHDKCSGPDKYHHGMVQIAEIDLPIGAVLSETEIGKTLGITREDPRWPRACPCGYEFAAGDIWQVFSRRLYRRGDGDPALVTTEDAPVGGMYWSPWLAGFTFDNPDHKARGGGPHLMCILPGKDGHRHVWDMDGPANNGPGWSRTGTPPLITANPSIGMGKDNCYYHGWLRNGVLVEV
jgi:hypothetical protein